MSEFVLDASFALRWSFEDESSFSNADESGMVWDNGLLVYKTGKPLPAIVVNDAIRRLRDERSQHILCKSS